DRCGRRPSASWPTNRVPRPAFPPTPRLRRRAAPAARSPRPRWVSGGRAPHYTRRAGGRGLWRSGVDCASTKYAELAKKCDVAGPQINQSLNPDEAIDKSGNHWQATAIHRDRLRDRPEEAGATGWGGLD